MSDPLVISLPRFAGPLDLLLELVRKNQVEIADIPIAEITRQYLDYMHQAAELDIDLGAEFTYMAATLIHLKTRSLLPTDTALAHLEPDPRQELIRQLLDNAQVHQAAQFLQQQLEVTSATWTKLADTEFRLSSAAAVDPPEDTSSMNLLELARLAQKALETARAHESLQLPSEEISIEEMIEWLQPRLSSLDQGGCLSFDLLIEEQLDQQRRIALFLAVLELSKSGTLRLEQQDVFEPIYLLQA